jgi:Tfp pilus assembly protein PilX
MAHDSNTFKARYDCLVKAIEQIKDNVAVLEDAELLLQEAESFFAEAEQDLVTVETMLKQRGFNTTPAPKVKKPTPKKKKVVAKTNPSKQVITPELRRRAMFEVMLATDLESCYQLKVNIATFRGSTRSIADYIERLNELIVNNRGFRIHSATHMHSYAVNAFATVYFYFWSRADVEAAQAVVEELDRYETRGSPGARLGGYIKTHDGQPAA